MVRNHRKSKGKEIKPTFFIFCEGESEDAYVSHLRSYYRIPIVIDSKVSGNGITQKYINNTLKHKPTHEKDKCFLLYDIDVPEMLERLKSINDSTLIASNPCFELWYVLHYCNQISQINTNDCHNKLRTNCSEYKKGKIPEKLKVKLIESVSKAIERAKKYSLYGNPSTNAYLLIEELNKAKKIQPS
jgi:hypothetical protein